VRIDGQEYPRHPFSAEAQSVAAIAKIGGELICNEATMLEEKLKEAIISELKRQAAEAPRSLQVEDSEEFVVRGKIDIDALVMVIAGSVAGGP
jgi:hypothetical protein